MAPTPSWRPRWRSGSGRSSACSNTLDDTDERLRLLDARLGAAVAGAAEVALGASGAGGADRLGAELDAVVTDLGALRTALDELG